MPAKPLAPHILAEIERLHRDHGYDPQILQTFAHLVLAKPPKPPKEPKSPTVKPPTVKPLTVTQLKQALYKKFNVTSTAALRKSGKFQMATDGMDALNYAIKATWEQLYRDLIGTLPDEEHQAGPECINGVNIFNYFRPWQVFNLDPQTATEKDIKDAYYRLSKTYHPDNTETGNRRIFERLEQMYRSLNQAP
ncbi:J domain-containing protein [Synechococcus sp. PCC 6312]|uniref:J domain-containing protein n=1 Tax=Synechococcus sp. (strain ATCC 27167 / PCC 6312) TaxID=195253 RepID=UPI00029F36C5|nr:J domain-containing protein [Synechococcus sp. PCC 6312]AFY60321.1 DnaJ-class molecular chaperone with C-terminal Zn finger domain [Synechococcus sp. PCC 6312]